MQKCVIFKLIKWQFIYHTTNMFISFIVTMCHIYDMWKLQIHEGSDLNQDDFYILVF